MNEKDKLYDKNGQQIFSIYRWFNLENGKIYFGKTERIPEIRKNEHIADAYNTNRDHYHIHDSIKSYGIQKFSFEIIFQCKNHVDLDWAEAYFIKYYNTTNKKNGYNLTYGGDGGKISEQTRIKMSESKLGEKNSFYGKTHTEETRKKLSEQRIGKNIGQDNPFYGKTHTEENRKIMSENIKKQFENLGHPRLGKTFTEKSKNKMSESHKMIQNTKEHAEKVQKFSLEKVNEIKQLYTEGYLQRELAEMFNSNRLTISQVLKNKGAYRFNK